MTIHDTSVVPYLIAQRVISKYMTDRKVGMHIDRYNTLTKFLEDKSERLFDSNDNWRIGLIKAKDERQYLFDFMYHWLEAEINKPNKPMVQGEMFRSQSI
jgi:hypothetical protein